MNFPIPPIFFTSSVPGRIDKISAFEITAFAPISFRSSVEMYFAVPLVATGIKNGVSISPFFVFRIPILAFVFLSLCFILNISMFSPVKEYL